MSILDYFDYAYAVEDEQFDQIYPAEIRDLSSCHWTPVAIARKAAKLLVDSPKTRVLDLGSGVGKFCMIGALTTAGHFTGVEQRRALANLTKAIIQREQIPNTEIINANVTDIDFSAYDAFYLFNPFEENLFKLRKIDSSVDLSRTLYERYTQHVAAQLARAPLMTRVVTYGGACEEVPLCYECQRSSDSDTLKLWQKTRNLPGTDIPLDARPARNRWRFLCDFAAQERDLWAYFNGRSAS